MEAHPESQTLGHHAWADDQRHLGIYLLQRSFSWPITNTPQKVDALKLRILLPLQHPIFCKRPCAKPSNLRPLWPCCVISRRQVANEHAYQWAFDVEREENIEEPEDGHFEEKAANANFLRVNALLGWCEVSRRSSFLLFLVLMILSENVLSGS